MVQDQLVEYISSQLKLNISRDAIKTALTAAGWSAQDVDDTFKKVEGASAAAGPAVSAVSASPAAAKPVSSSPAASPAGVAGAQPQMIKMSDLVSGSAKSDTIKPVAKPDAFGSFVASSSAMKAAEAKSSPSMMSSSSSSSVGTSTISMSKPAASSSGKKSAIIAESIEAVIVVALAIFAGYLYFNSQSLLTKIAQLQTASGTDASTASTLNSQIDSLNASTTALGSQVSTLSGQQQELALELSFYAVAPGTMASTTTATIGGTLSTVGNKYVLTMQYGAKVTIANSATAAIASQLKPNFGQSVQITGTYTPGSTQFTMTQLVSPVPATPATTPAATSTASSSASASPATTTTAATPATPVTPAAPASTSTASSSGTSANP